MATSPTASAAIEGIRLSITTSKFLYRSVKSLVFSENLALMYDDFTGYAEGGA